MDARFAEYRAAGGAQRHPDRPGARCPAGRVRQRRRPADEPCARASARDRVRLAIGGSRGRLMRQLITESALIAIAGGAAGLALGYGGIRSFRQFQIASDAGVRLTYELDRRALAVGLGIAAVSALLSSAIPAWRSTRARDLSSTLRNTTTPAARAARLWGRHGLVASQIALTLVLLTVALSFYRAFEAEYGRGPGFRTDHLLLTNSIRPRPIRPASERRFYQLLEGTRGGDPGRHIGRADLVCAAEPGRQPTRGHRSRRV